MTFYANKYFLNFAYREVETHRTVHSKGRTAPNTVEVNKNNFFPVVSEGMSAYNPSYSEVMANTIFKYATIGRDIPTLNINRGTHEQNTLKTYRATFRLPHALTVL